MKKKLLNKNKYPAKCEYCARGRLSPDGKSVLCPKKGLTDLYDSCRAYKYDVLKRVPAKQQIINPADPKDFEI
ncbi:MAG: hypothetical protein IK097_01215 [Clostridia bacterium]|nr:hypothetical protein [Clostridia bacterium]